MEPDDRHALGSRIAASHPSSIQQGIRVPRHLGPPQGKGSLW